MRHSIKRCLISSLFLFGLLCSTACSKTTSIDSKTTSIQWYTYPEFSEYYQVDHKGIFNLQIFCWRINENEWRCGLTTMYLRDTHSYLTLHYMQTCLPCPLNIMKEILKTYNPNISNRVSVFEVPYPCKDDSVIKGSIYIDYLCEQLGLTD